MEDSELSLSGGDFGFAFNNVNFSDRLLRIEITRSGEVKCFSFVDWVRDHKRTREEVKNHTHVDTCHVESELNMNLGETDYENKNNKHEDEMVIAEQQSQSGILVYGPVLVQVAATAILTEQNEFNDGSEDVNKHYSWWFSNKHLVLRVNELHISSAILAAKSPFFYKLFSNGMLESEQKHLTLKIDASEEAAVMELIYFMYSNSLSVTAASALLDVLMAADKFEVPSCIKYCIRLLLDMPMTLDYALLLLQLPSSLLMADSVKPLTIAAKQFIASRYKDICKFQLEEVMALPLVGIEAILASDDLHIMSENLLYELVLRWAKTNYSVLEERQEILGSHLARYIRFPNMTCSRLKKILTSDDFKPSVASKLVLEALFFKSESKHSLSRGQHSSINQRFVERAYKYRPIKFVEFKVPRQQCIVYLDLKRKECESLYPSRRMYSETFHLGGHGLFLSAHCNMDQLGLFQCFGLFLGMQEKGSVSLIVDYEFSARTKPTEEFIGRFKGTYMFMGGKAVGNRNLFSIPWSSFIAKDGPYFINDVLHLRADLCIRL